jgi:hypothetical protein
MIAYPRQGRTSGIIRHRSITGVAIAGILAFAVANLAAVSGTTTVAFSANPTTLVAGDDVVITTTTTAAVSSAIISAGKVQYQIATDGAGTPVPAALAVSWIRIDAAILGGGSGLSPDASGNTSLGVDLENLSSLGLGLSNVSCDATVGFRAHYVTGGGSPANRVDTHTSATVDLGVACACAPVEVGDALTRSQGFYGNRNGRAFLDAELASGLTVGIGHTLTFTSSAAIEAYFDANPNGGPGQLTASHVDPLTSTEAGIFGKQVTALAINLVYDSVNSHGNFGNLVFMDPTSPFHGMTVAEILAEAERVLGGGVLLTGATLGGEDNSGYNFLVDQLNLSFDDDLGTPSAWALLYLFDCGSQDR